MTDYHLAWLRAFALTLALEVPLVVWLTRGASGMGKRVVIAILANFASHPLVWFVFPTLALPPFFALGLSEIWAFGIEAVFFRVVFSAISWRRAALVSLAANALSFGFGLLVYERWILR